MKTNFVICRCEWHWYYDYRIMLSDGSGHVRVTFYPEQIIISDLFVREDCRHKGYATLLLDEVDSLTKGKVADIVPSEKWQRAWYSRRGYNIIDDWI